LEEARVERIERVKFPLEWFRLLVEDLNPKLDEMRRVVEVATLDLIKLKHEVGSRILKDILKFGRAEYGNKTIADLASVMKLSKAELYRCIDFERKYPDFQKFLTEFSHVRKSEMKLTWRMVLRLLEGWKEEEKPSIKEVEPIRCPFCTSQISYKRGVILNQVKEKVPEAFMQILKTIEGFTGEKGEG